MIMKTVLTRLPIMVILACIFSLASVETAQSGNRRCMEIADFWCSGNGGGWEDYAECMVDLYIDCAY